MNPEPGARFRDAPVIDHVAARHPHPRHLGTPKLQPPWDRIALLGPSVIVGTAYFIYELSQPHETGR
jgi:hypothetical protein